jgi:arylsulfatase B
VSPPERAVREKLGVPLSERFLPQYLKDLGYDTGMIGKWHLGPMPGYQPLDRGFDEYFGSLHSDTIYIDPTPPDAPRTEPPDQALGHYAQTIGEKPERYRPALNPVLRGREPVQEKEYLTDAFTREAVSFIDRHRDRPFFLYLAEHAPHAPLQTTDRYYDRFPNIKDEKERVYAGMVSAIDDGVGAIEEALKKNGLLENTLVLFLSDNGCATYTAACSNGPLLGGKLTPFEGGNRVPFIASWPGTIAAGRVVEDKISTLDLLPTALELAGGTRPKDRELDGASLAPFLRGKGPAPRHDELIWRLGRHWAVERGDWKLVELFEQKPLLYDLATDLGENHDLAGEHPDLVRELEAIRARWEKLMKPPLWPTQEIIHVPLQDIFDRKPMVPARKGQVAIELTT